MTVLYQGLLFKLVTRLLFFQGGGRAAGMPSEPGMSVEVLELLKFLRDNDYIQGIGAIETVQISEATGWNRYKLETILQACHDADCIGSTPASGIYITPRGLRVLL